MDSGIINIGENLRPAEASPGNTGIIANTGKIFINENNLFTNDGVINNSNAILVLLSLK